MNENYSLVERRGLSEIGSEGYLYKHSSGARILYVKNKDENKVFSAAFKTVPGDNRGIPHILEHCVLAGSRKYRVKEPFNELIKSSLYTYLNAMTYPDKTIYPIASCNTKDFFNLMDVYLDAVFFPLIYERRETFLQEGWRYTADDGGKIGYNGIVYNEMKGAYSDPYDTADMLLRRALQPDTPYSYDSGGDPQFITDLDYQELLDYHRKYYHPSNSYIYFYGDMDIEKCFEILDEYLCAFPALEVDPQLVPQQEYSEEVISEGVYSLTDGDDTVGKNYLAAGFVINGGKDIERDSAMSLLNTILLASDASPLKKELMERGVGEDIAPWFTRDAQTPSLNIIVKNSALTAPEFRDMLLDILGGIVEKGLDREFVNACISRLEFYYREEDFGYKPRGLSYNLSMLTNWLYGYDPFETLTPQKIIKEIQQQPQGYLEGMIQKYLLDNKHRAFITIYPQPGLDNKREAETEAKLERIAEVMSDERKAQISADCQRLEDYQNTPDTPEAIATTPTLSISDINREAKTTPLVEEHINGIKVLYSPLATRGIIYYNLFFDITALEPELLPYLNMLVQIWGKVGTKHRNMESVVGDIYANTGGLSFSTEIIPELEGGYRAFVEISAKVVAEKREHLFELVREILEESDLSDSKRIKTILSECRSGMEYDYITAGHSAAISRICAYFSEDGAYREAISGLDFYYKLKNLTDNFDSEFPAALLAFRKILTAAFRRDRLTVGMTCDSELHDSAAKTVVDYASGFSAEQIMAIPTIIALPQRAEAFITSSQVQYNVAGGSIKALGYGYDGSMRVLANVLSNEYLLSEIRMKSGAYGCGAVIGRNGYVYFYSYRDPALAATYAVYNSVPEYLRGFTASQSEMTAYILGAINPLDRPVHNGSKGYAAMLNHFAGFTPEMQRDEREALLTASDKDIRRAADALESVLAERNICTFGGESAIKQAKDSFREIKKL